MSPRQTVLVVEDDDALRSLYRNALSLAGFEVHDASNGFDALRRIDAGPPDVIVLDLKLPGLSGFAIQQETAAHSHTRCIPVVVATGSTEELGYLEVACILRKPIDLNQLILTVRRCLGRGAHAVET